MVFCNVCKVVFKRQADLQQHLASGKHKKNDAQIMSMSTANSTSNLKPKYTAKIYCGVCEKRFRSQADLQNHLDHSKKHKEIAGQRKALTSVFSTSDLEDCNEDHIAAIDTLVKSIAEEYRMTPEMLQQRCDTVEELNNLLEAKAIDCRLNLAGSTLSGFALKTSDVNVNIVVETGVSISTEILAVRELVKNYYKYSDVVDDLGSSIPTISFTHVSTGLHLVVGVDSGCSKMTNQLLADYASLDERVLILGVAFRRWAQLCHIDEQSKGTIPAHAFAIMVVYFLQQHKIPVLPVLHEIVPDGESYLRPSEFQRKYSPTCNNFSVGKLWLDMFSYFATRFLVPDNIISIRQKVLQQQTTKLRRKILVIEDPFQPQQFLTRAVSGKPVLKHITDCFKNTCNYFAILKKKKGSMVVKKENEEQETSNKQVTYDHFKFRFDANIFTGGSLPPLICVFCQKNGHCKAECPEDYLPPLNQLPPTNKFFTQQLTSLFEQLAKCFEPKKDEIDERDMIVSTLEKYLTSTGKFPGVRLHLFGSSVNGFGFQSSDLDICLTFDGIPTSQNIDHIRTINSLTNTLRKCHQYHNVSALTNTKVPIVKFSIQSRSHLHGDLSVYNILALQNTKLLATYSKIDYRVKYLGYAMKYFAKLCDIGDASQGSLSSYAYILMVLHFLQRAAPPVIPILQENLYDHSKPVPELIIDGWNGWFYDDLNNLSSVWPTFGKNKESIGDLWIGMLKYYTETFNWKENVITIRQFAPLTKLEKLWNSDCLVIEDPFKLDHNLAARLSKKMNTFIRSVFIRARQVFGTPKTNLPPGYLVDYLFDKKNLTDGAPPYDCSCKFCGKFGHVQQCCPKKKIKEQKEKIAKHKEQQNRKQLNKDRLEEDMHKQKEEIKVNERVFTYEPYNPFCRRESISYSLTIPGLDLKSHSLCWDIDKQYVEQGRIYLGMNRYKSHEFTECILDPGTVILISDDLGMDNGEYIWTFSAQVVYDSISLGYLAYYDYPYWSMYYFILKSVKDNIILGLECFQSEINQNDLFGEALKRKMKEDSDIRKKTR